MRTKTFIAALAASLACLSQAAFAGWEVSAEQSEISFVSVKKTRVAETHKFNSVSGDVTDSGRATINIALASVETGIPIRNERLQSMLFHTERFPTATVSAQIDSDKLAGLQAGQSYSAEVPLKLSLAGSQHTESAKLRVTGLEGGRALVTTAEPIVIDAADYGLVQGIEKLREVAGLDAISPIVPVTFQLVLDRS
ncbi:YceI family protein [Microbulbifer yueqingensis]|uniref:YceI-like domain-containing protein n=1 Tax=Microbulbifer yueqingensis TaxID=658219 RepID=A0A1G8UB63_9GAMM|nr:YceI family protein [Microbulbifer yueqingensis]SDJ50981.1 YceI-like domain-containing protein [Microbulbifer yueqingensis]